MTAGTGSDIGSSGWTAVIGSPGIRSFGRQRGTASSGKAVGSESTGMTAGHWSDIGSSGWTAGTGSPGIRSFGLTAGTASSGKAVGSESNRHDSEHRVIRYRIVWLDSGHRVTRHQVIWLDSGHRIRYRIIWINSGHRVNWPNRIVRLDQFIMLGRGIR
ncbi:unnamed protein product, partial [Staurois parvus]